ncbi:FMN-dependent NADH-azoreductase [Staphylococcus simulans]|uniref:FMN-dependent NADH-azoreductase n=1 Tax=Staphylococcus simulans TaxID=1286 RepID=UPI000D02FF1E|nr:FMN-dependent NADH-azoreductase [Staphylococcus simulans]MDU0421278.1 FMN-dependent NADH-azoreductase [Staphylococcus simulans]MDU0467951.1 FMN-dependent NADH-azoreductase [Staphylococcus simulans]PTJ02471.1 FMN-dependent NADH-azoreductase [Staphylococcus simulans]PTJ47576.1 FMN-dependent NADH-azoreductase [Staphylococcus simulans]PTJ86136.1 FMN-dependent NADH-azoreductase [Staphylococcus simulans]
MSQVLYITAHPLDEMVSNSMAVGKAFIDTYKAEHPEDEVVHIDLFKDEVPEIDAEVFSGWGKLQSGETLTDSEQQKVNRLIELVDQFVAADKYVFVTPMWNLSFPPAVKRYFDAVAVAGKTFKYTAEGPQGLLTDKAALHIQSRGGYYSEGPAADFELGDRYIRTILAFMGVPDISLIAIEGHNAEPENAEEIKLNAIQQAEQFAKQF